MANTKKPATADPEPEVLPATESVAVVAQEQPLIEEQVTALGPLIGGISTDVLKLALAVQTEQRELIKGFIRDHLLDGTDFGRIHVVSKDKCRDLAAFKPCNFDGHYSKRVLFKPGQEKLFSLFQISDTLVRDDETYTMFPQAQGLVAYKCTLTRAGQTIGHGRGAATLGDKGRDVNATLKIAEKRARMDACLSLGFSEYFTQDLDDPDYEAQAKMAEKRAAQDAEMQLARERTEPMSDENRRTLAGWMQKRGFTTSEQMKGVAEANGVIDLAKMTNGIALDLVKKLASNVFQTPPDPDIDQDYPLPDAFSDLPDALPAPRTTEPELVVDDTFRSEVHVAFTNLGLNNQGEMWFKRRATGKPYLDWDKLTDHDWRQAYALIDDIEAGAVEVEDRYIRGLVPSSTRPDDAPKAQSWMNDEVVARADQAVDAMRQDNPSEINE